MEKIHTIGKPYNSTGCVCRGVNVRVLHNGTTKRHPPGSHSVPPATDARRDFTVVRCVEHVLPSLLQYAFLCDNNITRIDNPVAISNRGLILGKRQVHRRRID